MKESKQELMIEIASALFYSPDDHEHKLEDIAYTQLDKESKEDLIDRVMDNLIDSIRQDVAEARDEVEEFVQEHMKDWSYKKVSDYYKEIAQEEGR